MGVAQSISVLWRGPHLASWRVLARRSGRVLWQRSERDRAFSYGQAFSVITVDFYISYEVRGWIPPVIALDNCRAFGVVALDDVVRSYHMGMGAFEVPCCVYLLAQEWTVLECVLSKQVPSAFETQTSHLITMSGDVGFGFGALSSRLRAFDDVLRADWGVVRLQRWAVTVFRYRMCELIHPN